MKDIKFKGAIIGNPMDFKLPKDDIIDLDFNSSYPITGIDYKNDKWNNIDLSKNEEYLEHKKRVYKVFSIDDILDKRDILLGIAKSEANELDTITLIENTFNRLEEMKKDGVFSFSCLARIINYCYYFDSSESISPENSKELNDIATMIDNFIRNNRDKIIVEKIFK